MENKTKKPIFKRWWFWAIIVVVVIAAIGGNGSSTKDPAADSSPSAAVSDAPAPTPSPAQQSEEPDPTTEISDVPEASAPQASDPSVSLDSVCTLIEMVLADNYSGSEVTHDEESITVNVWVDGLTRELTLAQESGADSYKEAWETAKTNTVTLAGSICDLIDTSGREDVYLSLNVLNDLNHDNVLLSIFENVVIYDVMAQ